MTAAQTRAPWVLWIAVMVLLVWTLTLATLNGFGEDLLFNLMASTMILGSSTVGALLRPGTPETRWGG